MAPLADNLTERYWADYEGAAGQHSIMFRFPVGTTLGVAITAIQNILTVMKVFVPTTTLFNRLRHSAAGTNVSFPVTWATIAGTNPAAVPVQGKPQFISWTGRSPDGRRVAYTLHGSSTIADVDYRIDSAQSAETAAVVNALNNDANELVTVSGQRPIVNNYANTGYNAYFQRKQRRIA